LCSRKTLTGTLYGQQEVCEDIWEGGRDRDGDGEQAISIASREGAIVLIEGGHFDLLQHQFVK